MIRAVFSGTTLQVQGHAGAAPHGQDLVCAAASALVYALAQRLTELHGGLESPPQIRLKPGDAIISVLAKKGYEKTVEEDFRLICSGFKLLESRYPQRVQVMKK